MEKRHKKLLEKNDFYIMTHLDIIQHPEIIDYLFNNKVLLESHRDKINSIPSNNKKVEELLFILKKRGPRAFDIFMDALVNFNYSFLKESLMRCLGENEEKLTIPTTESVDTTDFVSKFEESDEKIILIINNNNVSGAPERIGSKEDIEDLIYFFVKTLKYKLFNNKPYKDMSVENIKNVLSEFAKTIENFEKGFAVIVIMSHGLADHILDVDGYLLHITYILNSFNHVKDSVLRAFIFSCCRGTCPTMFNNTSDTDEIMLRDGAISVHDDVSTRPDKIELVWRIAPPRSIVLYSTQIDYVSNRYASGTIFIQSLLSVFMKKYKTDTLREMVSKVESEMIKLYPTFCQLPDKKENYFHDLML